MPRFMSLRLQTPYTTSRQNDRSPRDTPMQTLVEPAISVLLGAIFVVAGVTKLRRPKHFIMLVDAYRILPWSLARLYGRVLPPIEVATGLLLFTGTALRCAALAGCIMPTTFLVGLLVNTVRRRAIDCGCFGGFKTGTVGWRHVLEDVVLMLAFGVVLVSSRQWVGSAAWSPFRSLSQEPVRVSVALAACLVISLLIVLVETGKGETSVVTGRARHRPVTG